MVNGYVTLDLASKNIYKEALGAIKAGKPVMVVDAPDVYFADTIKTATVSDDVVVQITKGGKTITINDVNAVSSEGEIYVKVQIFGLYVGTSSEDEAIRLVTIDNINTTIEDVNFDQTETIEGLYKVITSLKNNVYYKFFNDEKELVEINLLPNGNITMSVNGVEVLACQVNSDDTITYTKTDGYFYISHLQLI